MGRFFNRKNSKPQTLSQELMLLSALAMGGAFPRELISRLTDQEVSLPAAIIFWRDHALNLLKGAESTGAPCGQLLRETARFARSDERRLARAQVIEKQFAFQAAVLTVLPWCVVSAAGSLQWNVPLLLGIAFQLSGLGAFTLLTLRLRKCGGGEAVWLRQLVATAWLHVRAGEPVFTALAVGITALERTCRGRVVWNNWLTAQRNADVESAQLCWHIDMVESRRLAEALSRLMSQGAPASDLLLQFVEHCESIRDQQWEEKLAMAPSILAVVMCLFFAPALFCLVASSLWNQIGAFLI